MIWHLLTFVLAFATSRSVPPPPVVGASVVFADTNWSSEAGRSYGGARWTRKVEIDGPRFRIGGSETSLDDGATTFFGGNSTVKQTPLARSASDTSDGGGTIAVWHLGEKLTVSTSRPGPTIAGVPTVEYAADLSYVTVTRAGDQVRRDSVTEHYQIAVGNLPISASGVRVMLSRGWGHTIAKHAEAFRGFPLRVIGHIVQGNAANGLVSDDRLEAVVITAWSWPTGP